MLQTCGLPVLRTRQLDPPLQLADYLEVANCSVRKQVGSNASPQTTRGYVEQMVAREKAVLERFALIEREITRNANYPDAPHWQIALRFGQIELEAHMRWAEETLAVLRKLAKERDRVSGRRKDEGHAGK